MPFADTPMKPGSVLLDAPPPLPKEAKRKAPPDWMNAPAASDGGLGEAAGNPLIQVMSASKKMDEAIQLLQVAAPLMAEQWAQLQQVLSQAATMALQSLAQPDQSSVGAPQQGGLMASPMPPMAPPMGAGGQMGPSGM